jgi:bifunctional non-homologous end joining protein LigD
VAVAFTHLDRLWWPDLGIRKRDVLDYYRAVAPVLLPHLRDRPFTIKRHYTSPRSPYEWVKDAPPEMPSWIPVAPLPAKSRGGAIVRYPVIDSLDALLWVVEFGAIDLHTWTSRRDRPERPDWVLFDLDPKEAPFAEVVAAAVLVREALASLGLESFPMTTGGEGMHVRVPIERRHTHAEARDLCRVVTGALRRTARGLFARVEIDCTMNGHGQQVVAPYSVRPLPGAPVATPLRWDELDERLDPLTLTMADVLRRVATSGDAFAGVLRGCQRLGPALARLR